MAAASSQARDAPHVEQALVDLLRVGLSGDTAGVRQLGRRLIRRPPQEISNPEAFRQIIGGVLQAIPAATVSFRAAEEIPVDSESRLPLLRLEQPAAPEAPILANMQAEAVQDVIDQRNAMSRFASLGLEPVRTVMLSGPPGVGKTMTARYVAAILDLPLLTIDLASLMSSFLGRTGQNLKFALDYAKSKPCVLLLDEFDAMAKRRDDDTDVGELKRLVNVLLIELDHWPSSNLLVAATNHPELLDRAVNRRFDVVLSIPLPEQDERKRFLSTYIPSPTESNTYDVVEFISHVTEGLSISDLRRIVLRATRRAALRECELLNALLDVVIADGVVSRASGPSRDAFCGLAKELLGYSDRQIASTLGVSHPTVGKAVSRWRAQRSGT